MGLKDFFSRWTKGEDRRAIEREELESRMTPAERAFDREDFEGKREDVHAREIWAGREAEAAARDEIDDV